MINLFRSSISDRRQVAECNHLALLQGLIPDRLLFILYVNDFPHNILGAIVCLYTDNTFFFISATKPQKINIRSASSIKDFEDCFAPNLLKINPSTIQTLQLRTRALKESQAVKFFNLTIGLHLS